MGKVLLAFLDQPARDAIIDRIDFSPRGRRSINDPSALRVELRRVASRGYAINNEELASGLKSVAAPVRDARGEVVAAVNMHASPYTDAQIVELLAPAIMSMGNLITSQLGGRPADASIAPGAPSRR
jgi:IclR family pca regulon transcriptional regulator